MMSPLHGLAHVRPPHNQLSRIVICGSDYCRSAEKLNKVFNEVNKIKNEKKKKQESPLNINALHSVKF